MVYGLLCLAIRERVQRESITKFEELIAACRNAEIFIGENQMQPEGFESQSDRKRCTFCRYFGHSVEQCKKGKRMEENAAQNSNNAAKTDATKLRGPSFYQKLLQHLYLYFNCECFISGKTNLFKQTANLIFWRAAHK